MSPSKSFQEYRVDVDDIFFYTWDGIFGDVAKYFAMWPWTNDIFDFKWMKFDKRWMPNL